MTRGVRYPGSWHNDPLFAASRQRPREWRPRWARGTGEVSMVPSRGELDQDLAAQVAEGHVSAESAAQGDPCFCTGGPRRYPREVTKITGDASLTHLRQYCTEDEARRSYLALCGVHDPVLQAKLAAAMRGAL